MGRTNNNSCTKKLIISTCLFVALLCAVIFLLLHLECEMPPIMKDTPTKPLDIIVTDTSAISTTTHPTTTHSSTTHSTTTHSTTPHSTTTHSKEPTPPRRDCEDLLQQGYRRNGVYEILVNDQPVPVYCDMEHGGWIVIQKRSDDSVNYNRDMIDYAQGFGDISGQHWLGLNTVHQLTATGNWTLHFDMTTLKHKNIWAEYSEFSVGEGTDFILDFDKSSYRGTAGNGGSYGLGYNHGCKFTTRDIDQERWSDGNCAQAFEGGFWYNDCGDLTTTADPMLWEWYERIDFGIIRKATLRIKKA